MNTKAIVFGLAFVGLVGSAWSDTDYSTWYQYDVSSGTGMNEAHWVSPDEPTVRVAPTAGNDYYVPVGKTFQPSTTATFAGRTLAIAGKMNPTSPGAQLTINDLRMLNNTLISYSTHCTLLGNFTAEGFVHIRPFLYGSNVFYYLSDFHGDENAVVLLQESTSAANAKNKQFDRESKMASPAEVTGSWSDFAGEFRIGTNTCVRIGTNAKNFSGKLSVLSGAILYPQFSASTISVGDFSMADGSELYLKVASQNFATFTVSKSLSLEAGAIINFDSKISTTRDTTNRLKELTTTGLPLFHLTDAAAQNAPTDDMLRGVIVSNLISTVYPRNLRLRICDNGDGTKEVVIKGDDAEVMKDANASNGSGTPLIFRDGSCWYSGAVPGADYAGDVLAIRDACFTAGGTHTYPNMTLYLVSDGVLYMQNSSATFKEVIVYAGAKFYTYGGPTRTVLSGKLTVLPADGKSLQFCGWANRIFRINADLSGSGNLKLYNNAKTGCDLELYGDNHEYTGALSILGGELQWDPTATPAVDCASTLYVTNGLGLGGAYAGTDSWKALTFGGHAKLVAQDNVIVTELTRGVCVSNAARFVVSADKVLSFAAPVTYNGELTKLGAGRLALGKAQFSAAGAAPTGTPASGCNVLTVSEGMITANDSQALDGVAVSFAAGTGLTVDASATDADLLAKGAISTKSGSAITYADSKLKVGFCGVDQLAVSEKSVAICTVPAEVAQTLELDVPQKVSGYAVSVTTRTNDDTSVTYVATLARRGLSVIFR